MDDLRVGPQPEQKTIAEMVDKLVGHCQVKATELQTWLSGGMRGAMRWPYLDFYQDFSSLVGLTGHLTKMKSSTELVIKCETWIDAWHMPTGIGSADETDHARKGVRLFREFYDALIKNDVINPGR